MRNRTKNVSRAALVAGGLTVVGMGLSSGSALADTASTAVGGQPVRQVVAGAPHGNGPDASKMPEAAKTVRGLIRGVGVPVPGSDAGPNDPQVPPKLIDGLPLSLLGKGLPGLS
ncbi:hypothetical protein [Actinomadura oligospora]|uniref:hypothetical protein n=1 Tax=Actinomadura oligospora TaxID=111804 RepID=UPI00047A7CEE|nr:hypothetical protein [Actinomadura oligospora]